MTGAKPDIQSERDRYVAFAFAAADLLLEVDAGDKVAFASGATQALLGRTQATLVGTEMLALIADADRAVAKRLFGHLSRMRQGGRLEPVPIRLAHAGGRTPRALLGACALPHLPGGKFITLTLLSAEDSEPAVETAPRDPATGSSSSDDLMAQAARLSGEGDGRTRRLMLVAVGGLAAAAKSLPANDARSLMQEIGASLRAISAGADSAGRLGDEEFGIIGGMVEVAAETVASEIGDLARAAGVRDGALETSLSTVPLGGTAVAGDAAQEAVARAVAYAVRSFTEARASLTVSELERRLPAAVGAAVSGIASLQSVIRSGEFSLVYQPIVGLNDRSIHHFEALLRFPDGRNTFETIKFAEGVGLVEEIDLAICRRALSEIRRTPGGHSIAINMSGRSLEGDAFRRELTGLLSQVGIAERRRLLFELTESSGINGVEEAANFLRELKRGGHAICLDDFGAGATAYAYLRYFDVDFVKVDGPFLRAAVEKDREKALIRSVCRLCRDLECGVVGEMIEEERQADAAARLGIDFGQGWLFGKPMATLPAYDDRAGRQGRRTVLPLTADQPMPASPSSAAAPNSQSGFSRVASAMTAVAAVIPRRSTESSAATPST